MSKELMQRIRQKIFVKKIGQKNWSKKLVKKIGQKNSSKEFEKKFIKINLQKYTYQRKFMNFGNWCNGELSKIGHHFSNNVI